MGDNVEYTFSLLRPQRNPGSNVHEHFKDLLLLLSQLIFGIAAPSPTEHVNANT
jgi:hypothetical protein